MARRRRVVTPDVIHHVINRGNRRKTIFHKPGDYAAFLEVLREACARFGMRLIAFCVMPNHWHLLVWPGQDVSLSAFMHWLTSTHVRRYHAHYELVGTGHLYQARYRNEVCDTERRTLATIRYVEANPLKAKQVKRAREWKWSSLWLRVNGDEEELLCPCPIELPSNWADYVDKTTPIERTGGDDDPCGTSAKP